VVKDILRLSSEPDLIDELGRHQIGNHRFDTQHGEQVEAKPGADHRAAYSSFVAYWQTVSAINSLCCDY
jgi:hypothetical protein